MSLSFLVFSIIGLFWLAIVLIATSQIREQKKKQQVLAAEKFQKKADQCEYILGNVPDFWLDRTARIALSEVMIEVLEQAQTLDDQSESLKQRIQQAGQMRDRFKKLPESKPTIDQLPHLVKEQDVRRIQQNITKADRMLAGLYGKTAPDQLEKWHRRLRQAVNEVEVLGHIEAAKREKSNGKRFRAERYFLRAGDLIKSCDVVDQQLFEKYLQQVSKTDEAAGDPETSAETEAANQDNEVAEAS